MTIPARPLRSLTDPRRGPAGPMRGPGPMGRGGPGPIMMGPVEKPRDFAGTMRKLIAYLGPYRLTILFVFLLAVGSTIFSVFGPKILGQATTKLFEGFIAQLAGTGTIDFAGIGRILLTVLGLYALSAALGYAQGWLMTNVAVRITYQMRRDVFEKIHRMPFRYFDGTQHGEILSRLINDVDTVNQTLNQSLMQIVTSAVTVVGMLGMMLSISWQMTLVAMLVIPLSSGLVTFIIHNSQRFFAQQQADLGRVNGHVEETFGAHIVVKAFNGEEKSLRQFDQYNESLYGVAWKAQFISGILMPMMRFVSNLGYVGVVITGGYLAVRGRIMLGDIQAFTQYIRGFTEPITQLANISNVLQQTVAAAERVFEFLEAEEETPDPEQPVRLEGVDGRVEFQNVHFRYVPDTPVIRGFSARIRPGQKVAIVGPTGAGKTTLVKLLMRFYDVDDGAILIDGHDVRQFARSDLRRLFGMVLQDTWLFNGTILENIRYGRDDATDEEVVAAARAARIDRYIRTLPEGYNTVINEEMTNISQGQKQLLTIARAFLANPPMLILDEATSSVDTHTELLIQEAMDDLMRGRTSFVIAHRLSTIRNADLILVVRDGNIVEQGTHEELMRRGGFYAELYNSQFETV
ncbi:MAG: ABC transporter ATP-binding protein [Chloroflexi bacterium]|nr:ABC transporter ATP-binding protein [Chloroflexota bacterium]